LTQTDEELAFLQDMVNFDALVDKTESEISEWAQEKWHELLNTNYWENPDNIYYIQLFVKYMTKYIPELQQSDTDESV